MLKERWPSFLSDLVEFQKIADALQPEFDKATTLVNGAAQEFSLFTMTEYGAGRWEEIFGIVPNPGDSLESRRSRIITRYLSALPYTYRSLLRYLEGISVGGFSVNLDAANYELFVSVRLTGYDQKTALLATLTEMLPANILLKLQSVIQQAVADAKIIPTAYMAHIVYNKTNPVERGAN